MTSNYNVEQIMYFYYYSKVNFKRSILKKNKKKLNEFLILFQNLKFPYMIAILFGITFRHLEYLGKYKNLRMPEQIFTIHNFYEIQKIIGDEINKKSMGEDNEND